MTKETYWGTVSTRKVGKFRKTLDDLLGDNGELSGLWLKVKEWYIEQTDGSERKMEQWESIPRCLTYKNLDTVKCLITYVTYGKQGYIRIGKEFDHRHPVTYQPGGFWSHPPCADLIKDALKHKHVLKTS